MFPGVTKQVPEGKQTKDLVIILTYLTSHKGMSLPVTCQPTQSLWSEKKKVKKSFAVNP